MALYLPDLGAVFVHVPKTGGSWVRQALERAGIVTLPAGGPGEHNLPDAYAIRGRRFAFVRNPLDWYESAWRGLSSSWPDRRDVKPLHRERSWSPIRFLTYLAGSRDFSDFMQSILWNQPGFASRMFEWYCGPPGFPKVEFVGRTESLQADLQTILGWLGWNGTLAEMPAANIAEAPKPCFPEWLKISVKAAESFGLSRWYYDENEKPRTGPFRISVE